MLKRIASRYLILLDRINRTLYLKRELRYWREREAAVVACGNQAYRCESSALGLAPGADQQGDEGRGGSRERLIAEIDRRGFLLSRVGRIPGATLVESGQFVARTRNSLELVDLNGWLGVKKCYRGNYWSFVNELRALHLLSMSKVNVPAILAADFEKPCLTISYIRGTVLTDHLARQGAAFPNREIREGLQYRRPSETERMQIIEAAKGVVKQALDSSCLDEIRAQLRVMHSVGIVWNDFKYGNIVLEASSGRPFLIDFENARYRKYLGEYVFRRLCERDRSIMARCLEPYT